MYATIQKWGNSQGLRIPKALLDAVGLKEHDRVELVQMDDGINIRRASSIPHHEQKGRRPALVISNNLFNRVSSLTMVCPITHTDRGHPFHLRLDERTRTDGVILCDQARMLDLNSRHASFVERAPEDISSEAVDMVIGFLEPK